MNFKFKCFLLFLTACVVLSSCVEPFYLPESVPTEGLLVVDGSLNVEQGTGSVILTRTQQLNDTSPSKRVHGATVKIETENGESYQLDQWLSGEYRIDGLNLEYNKKYRLRVKLSEGKEYISEFVSTAKTPEIDELTWQVERQGVQVNLNTHDPSNKTRYYRWEYVETYEFNSGAESEFELINGEAVWRQPGTRPFVCWRTEPSYKVLVGSTVKLNQDVVNDLPIAFQPDGSRHLSRRYSILVRQFAISKEEFEYWEMVKKNTENVGSLFDAQPSQVTGNLINVNDEDEQVFGYFTINSVTEKRLFISASELVPYGFRPPTPKCELDSISVGDVSRLRKNQLLLYEIWSGAGVWGYRTAEASCADCSKLGGDRTRPDFW